MARVLVDHGPTTAALRAVRRSMPGYLQKGLVRHAAFATKYIAKERFSTYPGPDDEDKRRTKLYRRLGKLQGSIRFKKVKDGVVISAGEGLPDNRAVENEEGIVKKGNPYIEVPLPANLTPKTGQKRVKTAAEALQQGGFQARSSLGNQIIFKRRGTRNRGKLEALFVLKTRTVTKPRFQFERTLRSDKNVVKNRDLHVSNAVRRSIVASFGRSVL